MILKNSKGQERNFKIIYKISYQNDLYYIFEDYITNKKYIGKKSGQKIEKIDENEMNLAINILKKVCKNEENSSYNS